MRSALIAFAIAISGAASNGATAADTLEETCRAVLAARPASQSLGWGELWRLLYLPGSFVSPRAVNEVRPPSAASGTTKILYFVANSEMVQELSASEASRLRAYDADLLAMRKHFSRMARRGGEEECVEESLRAGFDGSRLRALANPPRELRALLGQREARQFSAEAARASLAYAYPEVIPLRQADEEVVQAQSFEDLVVIAHADEQGRLYDADRRAISREGLAQLAQSARSLAIYACHPNEVQRHYGLSAWSIPVYLPRLEGPFAEGQQAPLTLFGAFAERHAGMLGIAP